MKKVRIFKGQKDTRTYVLERTGRDGKGVEQASAETKGDRKAAIATLLADPAP